MKIFDDKTRKAVRAMTKRDLAIMTEVIFEAAESRSKMNTGGGVKKDPDPGKDPIGGD